MAANSLVHAAPGWGEGELVTPTQINLLDLRQAQSINRHNSVGGWGAIPFHFVGEYATGGTGLVYSASGGVYMTTGAGTKSGTSTYSIDLRPMKGHSLDGVRLHITPAGGHAGQPAQLPVITLYRIAIATGVVTNMGTATYAWGGGDPGNYQAGFFLSITGLAHTIDTAANDYRLEVTVESGLNYVDNGKLDGIQANITVDASEGGPDIVFWP